MLTDAIPTGRACVSASTAARQSARDRRCGHVAYPLVGDTVNTGARLEGLAPVGGILIGEETYEQLPDGAVVEERTGLRIKGKDRRGHRVRAARAALDG